MQVDERMYSLKIKNSKQQERSFESIMFKMLKERTETKGKYRTV